MLSNILTAIRSSFFSSDDKNNEKYQSVQQEIPSSDTILERSEHNVSRAQISRHALSVLYELRRADFEAYLVGGCIRDLLLGDRPKDFDIATNATPEQVHNLFKRSRIVGRRFKIVHVRSGREVIEVTTFRTSHDAPDNNAGEQPAHGKAHQNAHGMLIRDNVYGNVRDDALRRDFTINALYYSIDGFRVFDYTGGLRDLQNRTLRIIGDAEQRYREDPVRMLRAVRFAARLNFEMDAATSEPIARLNDLLTQVAPARLFDEVAKLFLTTQAVETLQLMFKYRLIAPLFPASSALLQDKNSLYYPLLIEALNNTAERIRQQKSVTPAFLYANLLWPHFNETRKKLIEEGSTPWQAGQRAGQRAIAAQLPVITIPKRFSIAIREIWGLQYSLETTQGKRTLKLLGHPRFRAAYDFMLMRERSGETLNRSTEFWTQLQQENPQLLNDQAGAAGRERYRNKSRRHRGGNRNKTQHNQNR